jgi:hypothetical protein
MIASHLVATILKHDTKTTSYKFALLRALNELVLTAPEVAGQGKDVAVPLRRLAELWIGYYWPFMDGEFPIYQGARAEHGAGVMRNDVSFRPALTKLRQVWAEQVKMAVLPSDGAFLTGEMRLPRRRASYGLEVSLAYEQAVGAIVPSLHMPIKFAGAEGGHWTVFAKPARLVEMGPEVYALPGTLPQEPCLVVASALWATFHELSLYVEALCLHEWSLFTEQVRQTVSCSRGQAYTLLTAQPGNRRPLTWERNQVDVLLAEQGFVCPWTRKLLTSPAHYDLDHLLPLCVYPINELWNLIPVDRKFNQHVKRDRVPSADRLTAAQPLLADTYTRYLQSVSLQRAVREDAGVRFGAGVGQERFFPLSLARQAVRFIEDVAQARFVTRF